MKKNVTIKDLANEVCMSLSTVSRAINDAYNVNKETRDKVLEAAKRLGYRRNEAAASLRNGKKKVVGVIVPDMNDSFFFNIYKGISGVLETNGYLAIIAVSEDDTERERDCLLMMTRQNVDGIIMCVCDSSYNKDLILEIEQDGTPFVFFDRLPDIKDSTTVEIDNEKEVYNLVKGLYERGMHRMCYVMGLNSLPYDKQRLEGYMKASKELGIFDSDKIFRARSMYFEDGIEIATTLLDILDYVDVIVTSDDMLALGILREFQKLGIRIPDDVAISGLGGSNICTMVYPQITTFEFPMYEIGSQSARCILNKMNNPYCANEHIRLSSNIIFRESTDR